MIHSETLYWLTCDGCGTGTDVGEWKGLHGEWATPGHLRHAAGLVGWRVRRIDERGRTLVYPRDMCPHCEAGL